MNFHFERTSDFNLIRRVMTHPSVYGHISDDSAPPRDKYVPELSDRYWHVAAYRDDVLLGLWVFLVCAEDIWEVHTCLLPASYGIAARAGRAMAEWIWANTPCKRISSYSPVSNKLAIQLAKGCGMVEVRREEKKYLKRGVLEDVAYLELVRPDADH